MNKLIVILGPTASGKTGLSIRLALRLRSGQAKKFGTRGAEIVSADSRQVYKGMDIGSGKITKKEMTGVHHHLLDVANPKRRFTVAQYQKLALKAIEKIHKKNKIPILVGGTGFYIQSVVDSIVIPEVKPDWKLRKKLEKMSNEKLYKMLLAKDPKRAKNIDRQNPRRLIRALEIIIITGNPVSPLKFSAQGRPASGWDILQIGVAKSPEELKNLIHKRLIKRLAPLNYGRSHASRSEDLTGIKNGAMINEVKKLRKSLSWKRLEEFGLEYRFVAQYLQNKTTYQEMTDNIQKESEHYSKRQMTWFKRDKRIRWIQNQQEAEKLVNDFLKK